MYNPTKTAATGIFRFRRRGFSFHRRIFTHRDNGYFAYSCFISSMLIELNIITNQSGLNSFKISVKEFVERTGAVSITAKAGRYGGTYAHKDIAFEFAMWISPQFKIYIVKEFQRLKDEEQKQLGWSAKKELAKINYRIHTDAIKNKFRELLYTYYAQKFPKSQVLNNFSKKSCNLNVYLL